MEITQAIERRKLLVENRDYQKNLEVKVKERTQEVQKLFGLLEENYFKTILMFVDLMELRDPFLGGHSKRVALLATRTGKKFNKDERWLQDLEVAGLLHDIGTLGLPEKTLKIPRDKLSEAELELLANQTIVSQETLSAIERLKNPARIIRSHMEWIDGHGFPDGLKDEQIPIESKILAVANAYDEVKNRRRFNVEPMASHVSDEARAISHLKEHAGKHFDRKVVEKFIETIEEIILAQKGAYVVSIADLNEGMTLAEDLTADNGTLLLAKGNRLSNLLITKIRNYSKMVSLISMKILVYQKAQIKTP
ncbi:MAG: HD domain-containing protein [Nitrospinae bacterium]|nr:HD domain-containing protein [Nitrospinota bacterium]